MSLLLIRYSELALKSPRVRSRFQNRLIANIENSFLENKLECTIDHDWGRIYIYPEDEKKGIELLRHIFGIVSVSPVIETTSNLDTISQQTIGISSNILKKNMTFAIRSRRTGSHDYTSQDVARRVGADILKANSSKSISVNLTTPDIEIFIEVRNDKAFIFTEKIYGPGGLPLGTQGKAVALLSNKNSIIAMWLLMKRGCKIAPVYIENLNSESKIDPNREIDRFRKWDPFINFRYLSDDDGGVEVSDNFELQGHTDSEYAAAETLARKLKADAIVTGETYEQLKNKNTSTENPTTLPIFYPLVGLDEPTLNDLTSKIF